MIFIVPFCLQFSADVVACNRNPKTGMVQGLDTYNEPDQRVNDVDPHQNVVQFSSNYTEGRIICRYVTYLIANYLNFIYETSKLAALEASSMGS